MVFNLVAASFTGVAISYAIGQSAPMVAALWGVLAWKEFAGAAAGQSFTWYDVRVLLPGDSAGGEGVRISGIAFVVFPPSPL